MKKFLSMIIFLLLIVIGISTYAYFSTSCIVTFIVDGVGKKERLNKTTNILDVKVPQKSGYKFLYWMDDDVIVDKNYKIYENAILVALFEKLPDSKKYTITFDTAGGSIIDEVTVLENKKIEEPENPVKTGYIFKEWTLDDESYDFDTLVTKDMTLKATYIEESKKTYMVTFNTDGGSTINPRRVEENSTVSKPSNPIKTGYTFVEWQLNGKTYNFSTPVVNNITLKAIYKMDERTTYTVTFDSNGGTEIYSQTVKGNDKAVKPENPVKSGYTFANWLLDSNVYDFNTSVTKDITLKAVYTKDEEEATTNSYVVTFDTDGGSSIDYQLIKENEKVERPSNPIKGGYIFIEWQLNGSTYSFDTPVTKAITLKAIYKEDVVVEEMIEPTPNEETNETEPVTNVDTKEIENTEIE